MPARTVQQAALSLRAILRSRMAWLIGLTVVVVLACEAMGSRQVTVPSAHQVPTMAAASDRADHDHGPGLHHHSGDLPNELPTLGHSHAGCSCGVLLSSVWRLDVIVHNEHPVAPWRDRGAPRSAPENPFRPPIA